MKPPAILLWLAPLLGAGVTGLLSALMLRQGVILSPDGWAYWEGSVSLLHGRGFNYFGGHYIVHYPPLFSIYLALWQALIGIRGSTLCIALAVTSGVSALIWIRLFLLLFGAYQTWLHSVLLVAFVSSFVAVGHALLLSEPLQLPLHGLMLLTIAHAMLRERPPSGRYFWIVNLWLGSLLFLMLLCRNATLAYVPALGLFVFRFTWQYLGLAQRDGSPGKSAAQSAPGLHLNSWFVPGLKVLAMLVLVVVVPVAAWHRLRSGLRQLTSHPLLWFDGHHSPVQYFWQIAESCMFFMGPDFFGPVLLLGLLVVVLATAWPPGDREQRPAKVLRYLLVFIASSVAMLYLIFNMTYVEDPLRGRYLWFVPFMLVGSAIALTTLYPPQRWRSALLGMLTLVVALQVFRSLCFAAFTLEPTSGLPRTRLDFVSEAFCDCYDAVRGEDPMRLDREALGAGFFNMYALLPYGPGRLVQQHWSLHPDWFVVGAGFPGPFKEEEGIIYISPPDFPWMDRTYNQRGGIEAE